MNTLLQMGKNFIQNPAEFVGYGLSTSGKAIKSQASKIDQSLKQALNKDHDYDARLLPEDSYEKTSTDFGMMETLKLQKFARHNKR